VVILLNPTRDRPSVKPDVEVILHYSKKFGS
jgi:hypothetical protein